MIASYLPYVQIILSVILVGLILLQQSDASIGAAFGGDSLGGSVHTRRGPEKIVFVGTIVIAVLFALSAFVALILR
ncbi:MAG TPA: preprotein translocase subunit SecG [Candidatus Paceibacterota bacterium]